MSDALQDGLSAIAAFVPKLLLFLVILLIGWLIAKAIAKALSAILERVGFDGAVERGGVKNALANSQYDASDVVGKIIYYALLLFVFQLAFGVFPANPISDLIASVIAFLPKLIVAIVIIVVASAIAAAVGTLIRNSLGALSYAKVVAGIASGFILFLGVIAALNQINVASSVTTPLLYAVLTMVVGVGVVIVGAGGGLIKAMQPRWESYLSAAESEAPKIKDSHAKSPSVKQQAAEAKNTAQAHTSNGKAKTGGASAARK